MNYTLNQAIEHNKKAVILAFPFTLNVLSKSEGCTYETFANKSEAIEAAKEECKWEYTIHATVTDERTGIELFDQAGEQI